MIESEEYTQIASWWDRKGENEIDIIAADELEQKVIFYEVKRQAKDINLGILKESRAFLPSYRKIQEIRYRIPRIVDGGYVKRLKKLSYKDIK